MERRHEVPAMPGGEGLRVFFRFLIVAAELDEIGALGAHGRILLGAISARDYDVCGDSKAARRQSDRLPVITASRGYQSRDASGFTKQFSHVDHGGSGFEGADGSVVLVFDPYFGLESLAEQGPDDLRRRRHDGVDELLSGLDFVNSGQGCDFERWLRHTNLSSNNSFVLRDLIPSGWSLIQRKPG